MTQSASAMTTVGMGSPVVPSALIWVRSRPSCSWAAGLCHAGRVAGCGQVALLGGESLGDVGGQLAGRGPVMAGYLLGDRRCRAHEMFPPRTDELLRRRAGAGT